MPPAVERVSRGLLLAVAAFGLIWSGALALTGERARSVYFVPLGLSVAALGSLALNGKPRAGAAFTLLTLTPLPWAVDTLLGLSDREPEMRQHFARKLGIPYDSRSVAQVVADLRAEGRDAWPASYPRQFTPDAAPALRDASGARLQPLAGVSGVATVHGNEEGRYLIYDADEHGFHNPAGLWELPQLDVLAVGDSFTHGSSVPTGRNLVAMVRRRWPATLNLGYGGNGPLMELASLLEYAPQRQPKVVLWVLCEANDIGEDLQRELGSELLTRYLKERRPLQNLEARQGDIDSALRAHLEKLRAAAAAAEASAKTPSALALSRVRQTAAGALASPPPDRWDVFENVLRAANETVEDWGGRLYLVYLPVHYAFADNRRTVQVRGTPVQRRQRAGAVASSAGVAFLDLEPVFEEAGRDAEEYVYPYRSHFTALGYEALGEAVVARLESDGILD